MIRRLLRKQAAEDTYAFPKEWRVSYKPGTTNDKRREELDMWRQWKESNEDPKKLEPLMRSMKGVVDYRVRVYAPANVYTPALKAKANNLTIQALRNYDPTKAQLNTHVTNNLKGLNRWTATHQNVARITESRVALIGKYSTSRASLAEELGYTPTHIQIADHMGVSAKIVKKLELEDRPDLVSSAFDGDAFADDLEMTTMDKEVMELIEFALTPDELKLWIHLYGLKGNTRTTNGGTLASKTGWSASKVSQVRKKIAVKVEYYATGLT